MRVPRQPAEWLALTTLSVASGSPYSVQGEGGEGGGQGRAVLASQLFLSPFNFALSLPLPICLSFSLLPLNYFPPFFTIRSFNHGLVLIALDMQNGI